VVAGGKIVRLAVTCPFFTAKSPLAVTGDWVVVFFGSAGMFCPLFTHESTRVAVADAV